MPASVTIESSVWAESRFDVLALLLGVDGYSARARMAAIWADCTERETCSLRAAMIAVHLGCAVESVLDILVTAELGEPADDQPGGSAGTSPGASPTTSHPAGPLIRLKGTNEKRTLWLAKNRASAASGGKSRAAKAKRGVTGSFQPDASHPAGEAPATRLVHDQPSDQRNTSASASASASVLPPSGGIAPAREEPSPPSLADDELLALTEPLPSGPDRERAARALWLRQEQIRQRVVPGAPTLAGSATPGGPLDAVRLALGTHSPVDLCRALAVREAEAECLRNSDDDPLRYLNGRTNWTAANLDHALATTPEAMRRRFAAERKRAARGRVEEPVRKIRLLADSTKETP